jgi:hypothetical protein
MSTNTFCPTANLRTPNLARQLAKASWVAPLVGICLNYLTAMEGNPPTVQIRIGAAAFGFYLAGVVFGIAAIRKSKDYGRSLTVGPASVGICVNTVLMISFLSELILAYTIK